LKKGCIVTDVGSTKGKIVSFVNGLENPPCFIGGHPMAGAEKTGYGSGYSHLFENAYYLLTPCKATTPEALDTMVDIIKGIGAIPLVLNADEHDMITGGISHLPHIIASALVNLVSSMETADEKMKMLAAGGFRDITRIASSSPEMWENIIFSNSEKVISLLDSFEGILHELKRYINNGESPQVLKFLEKARDYRNSLSTKPGLLMPVWELVIDVVDKPGIIGNIATLLGNRGINIKNINVSNNREFEQGCLRISLPDAESLEAAYLLLTDEGYKAYKGS
jgi:prephenate dehydrogenase